MVRWLRCLQFVPMLAVGLALWEPTSQAAPAAPAAPAPGDMDLHGFVEPCTVGNQQEMYTECELCPATPADPQVCDKRLGRIGYEKKCRTRGEAAAWDEVWCIDKRLAEQTAHRSKTRMLVAGAALLLGVSLFLVRARARRRPAK